MIQALHYDIVCNKVIIRACIMDSEMPYLYNVQELVTSGGRRGSVVLAGERKGSSSHSGEWRDSGVLSGAMARAVSCTWAVLCRPGQRENTETVAKLPQPAQPRYRAWGARPKDHVITNSA